DSQNAKKKRTLQKTFLGQTTLECPSKRRKLQQVAITEDAVPDPWRERFCRNVERKISRVGNNYQATIPSLQCNSKDIGGVLIKTEDIQKQACSVPPESCNNLNYKEVSLNNEILFLKQLDALSFNNEKVEEKIKKLQQT
ncbi:hypothetical protein RFI_34698, partial [Reticulomyxa filosa]